MIKPTPLERSVIDLWPIPDSGLPPRVVHALAELGCRNIADLRALSDRDLKETPKIGAGSIKRIHGFLETCERIESGLLSFPDLESLLDRFLSRKEKGTVISRYGLSKHSPSISRKDVTLQKIGRQQRVCRERVRQVENRATDILGKHLAQCCMDSLIARFENFLNATHGLASAGQVETLQMSDQIGDYSPSGVLRLLAECSPRIACHRDYFSSLPRATILSLESKILTELENAKGPLSMASLIREASAHFPHLQEEHSVIPFLTMHCPEVSITNNDMCFLPPLGAAEIVTDAMEKMGGPQHFKTVQRAYNSRLRYGGKKGPGFILDTLRSHPQFRQISAGHYELIPSPDKTLKNSKAGNAPRKGVDCDT